MDDVPFCPRGWNTTASIVHFQQVMPFLIKPLSLSLSLSVSLLLFQPQLPFFPAGCLSKFSNLRFPVRYLLRASSSTARVQLQKPSRSSTSLPSHHTSRDVHAEKHTDKKERHGHVHMLPVRPSSQPPPNYGVGIRRRHLPLIAANIRRKWGM